MTRLCPPIQSHPRVDVRLCSTSAISTAPTINETITLTCAHYIEASHQALPIHWGGTIFVIALSLRLFSLPLIYYNQLHLSRYTIATKAFPQIQHFVRQTPGSLLQKYLTFRRLRGLALRSCGTSSISIRPWYLLTHMPLVIGSSMGMREIAGRGIWDDGFGWIEHLGNADPIGVLPVVTTGLWVWNLERRAGVTKSEKGRKKDMMERMMTTSGEALSRMLQMICVASLTVTMDLPSGLVLFWFFNGSLTTLQRYLISYPPLRRQIGLVTPEELALIKGPDVMTPVGKAMETVRQELSYVQREVVGRFSGRRVDETLCNQVNRALDRERWSGRIRVDLEAVIRHDNDDSNRPYIAVVMKGKQAEGPDS